METESLPKNKHKLKDQLLVITFLFFTFTVIKAEKFELAPGEKGIFIGTDNYLNNILCHICSHNLPRHVPRDEVYIRTCVDKDLRIEGVQTSCHERYGTAPACKFEPIKPFKNGYWQCGVNLYINMTVNVTVYKSCTAHCNSGYKLKQQHATVRCGENLHLNSSIQPMCVNLTKDCAPLPKIMNGSWECFNREKFDHYRHEIDFYLICFATCREGLYLSHEYNATCREDFTWIRGIKLPNCINVSAENIDDMEQQPDEDSQSNKSTSDYTTLLILVAVGAALVVILVVILVVLCCWRRRRNNSSSHIDSSSPPIKQTTPSSPRRSTMESGYRTSSSANQSLRNSANSSDSTLNRLVVKFENSKDEDNKEVEREKLLTAPATVRAAPDDHEYDDSLGPMSNHVYPSLWTMDDNRLPQVNQQNLAVPVHLHGDAFDEDLQAAQQHGNPVQQFNRQQMPQVPHQRATHVDIVRVSQCGAENCVLPLSEMINQHWSNAFLKDLDMRLTETNERAVNWFGVCHWLLCEKKPNIRTFLRSTWNQQKGTPGDGPFTYILDNVLTGEGFTVGHLLFYFTQRDFHRKEIVELIKNYHKNCPFCDNL